MQPRFNGRLRIAGVALIVALGWAAAAAAAPGTRAGGGPQTDPQLLSALSADPQLVATCACLRRAAWLAQSYPTLTVDVRRFNALSPARKRAFAALALRDAKAVYLREWAAVDFYDELFIVDARGKTILHYEP